MNNSVRVIAFDLHGVVFRLDWRQIVKLWWRYPHKFRLFLCCVDPRMIWHGIKVLLKHPTDEECYAVFERFSPTVLPFIIACTNAQKPIEGTLLLIRQLKERGYQLHGASNTGPRRFAAFQENFADIINLFDCIYCSNGKVNNMVKKPQKQFFDGYCAQCSVVPGEVLFIDDSKRNITAAEHFGFNTVLLKNPQQLREALKNQGII